MRTIFFTQITLLLFVIPNFSWAQVVTVSGYVSNGINSKSLEYVNIFDSNSGIGTITNQNGFYRLVLEKGILNLNVTETGFKAYSQTFELESDTTLTIVLEPNLNEKSRDKKNPQLQAVGKTGKKDSTRRGFNLF
ncbi:carboxypeptidase-like regulatory domain-containing protein [Prolixibacteraceae bacterium Z1-6]|uniref:Carboxypeptidase-like regulatory domain-containing protein n=1 Tax=Draconibacterium aestuarii TaxID=2998507 RepID=A0A9X3F4U1_9BACT|nr:carboxypeptidase-like regulatory domain-containing protein [Prolixibacteraceae bacterium Z1-6]